MVSKYVHTLETARVEPGERVASGADGSGEGAGEGTLQYPACSKVTAPWSRPCWGPSSPGQ